MEEKEFEYSIAERFFLTCMTEIEEIMTEKSYREKSENQRLIIMDNITRVLGQIVE